MKQEPFPDFQKESLEERALDRSTRKLFFFLNAVFLNLLNISCVCKFDHLKNMYQMYTFTYHTIVRFN